MKGGWRHGVTGIDDADSSKTSVFYSEKRDMNASCDNEKSKINNYRGKILALGMGTSAQQDMASENMKRSSSLHAKGQPDRVVEIADKWKSKKAMPGSHKNTMQRIFEPASNVNRTKEEGCMNKIKIERSLKLRDEEMRGRKFNPVTGTSDKEEWLGSFGSQLSLVSKARQPATT